MKHDGFRKAFAGKRVWFLTANNSIVETTILRDVARTLPISGRDYTIFLFSNDLPGSIEPIRVSTFNAVFSRYTFSDVLELPFPLFCLEQKGNVSANIQGFTVP